MITSSSVVVIFPMNLIITHQYQVVSEIKIILKQGSGHG